ncbi:MULTISPECIES: ribonuclease toxin immunity protein CdiI [Lysinibacillus]|uniref:CDI immunity protein domain-containing protein n=1 Tax=Lysinibacillus irui TaxID=2998077 RepID=A0AAJ5URZ6_9BACI|nr:MULTISPECIES: hypothetical protein [Lysinibacillus]WDV05484.1 hypothetical protein OU989_14365 [Lysinibacillus irui]
MLQIDSKEEIKEFMETFFGNMGVNKFIRVLNEFKNRTGFGMENIHILFYNDFEEWDEFRCKENEVSLIMEYPAVAEDTIGYTDFLQLYIFLVAKSKNYILKQPELLEEINELLKEVKNAFGLE